MERRGTLVLKPIVELTIAAFVIVSFLGIAKMYGTGEAFLQERFAREGALFADAFLAVPGVGWVGYLPDVSPYTLQLEHSRFRVVGNAETAHAFASADDVEPRELVTPEHVFFFHDGKSVSIADDQPAITPFRCAPLELDAVVVQARLDETSSVIDQLLGVRCGPDFLCAAGEGVRPTVFVKVVMVQEPGVTARFFYDSPRIEESRTLACAVLRDVSLGLGHSDVPKRLLPADNQQRAAPVPVWMLPTDDPELGSHRDVVTLLIEADESNLVPVGRVLCRLLKLGCES